MASCQNSYLNWRNVAQIVSNGICTLLVKFGVKNMSYRRRNFEKNLSSQMSCCKHQGHLVLIHCTTEHTTLC